MSRFPRIKTDNPNTVGIIDVGIGNTASLISALKKSGVNAVAVTQPGDLHSFSRLMLPGVGNFAAFGRALKDRGFWEPVKELANREGKSLLGICVGAQILLSGSEESPLVDGLNLIDGAVRKILPQEARLIPRVGWDSLHFTEASGLSEQFTDASHPHARYFFSHSFCMDPSDPSTILAVSNISTTIPTIVRRRNLFAVQFHPERSGISGQKFLRDFTEGLFDAS